MNTPSYDQIALDATRKYNLDVARVTRALALVNQVGKIYQSPHSPVMYAVRGSAGWYFVDTAKRKCTCKDSCTGHICYHRIAVYILGEYTRQVKAVWQSPPITCHEVMLHPAYCSAHEGQLHMLDEKGKCHGDSMAALTRKGYFYLKHVGGWYRYRTPPTGEEDPPEHDFGILEPTY
jgi:hypothetical protein